MTAERTELFVEPDLPRIHSRDYIVRAYRRDPEHIHVIPSTSMSSRAERGIFRNPSYNWRQQRSLATLGMTARHSLGMTIH